MSINRQTDNRPVVLEALEPRMLLSATVIEELAAAGRLPAGAIEVALKDGPALAYDHGDHYSVGDQRQSLLRLGNQLAVKLKDQGELVSLAPMMHKGGELAGFTIAQSLGPGVYILQATTPELVEAGEAAVQAAMGELKGSKLVEWAAPVFVNTQTGTWQVAGDGMIVKLAPGAKVQDFAGAQVKGYTELRGSDDEWVFKLGVAGTGALNLSEAFAQLPGVVWAEPNFLLQPMYSTVDPYYGDQWHLNNTGQTGAASDADVDAPEAWSDVTADTDLVICIMDSGIDIDHPDLNIWTNPGETPDNDTDDDGNGYIDDVHGWDFAGDDADPYPDDYEGHGTSVAGVAAAIGDNGEGVKGAAPGIQVMPIRLAWDNASLAEGIRYAAGLKSGGGTWTSADLFNASWGGMAPSETVNSALEDAATEGRVRDGEALGLPMFVATGNWATEYQPDYETFGAGDYQFKWTFHQYSGASETAWLDHVELPDGTLETFTSSSLPTGWSTGGDANWEVSSDPAHLWGDSNYALHSNAVDNAESTWVMSPQVTVSSTGRFSYFGWTGRSWSNELTVKVSVNGGAFTEIGLIMPTYFAAQLGVISYPAVSPYTIAVGGSTDWDYRTGYAAYGDELDIVAPTSSNLYMPAANYNMELTCITTTDLPGELGYNTVEGTSDYDPLDLDYTSKFGGTSSASPLAAGVGALVLSKNPDLTATQVRSILRASADKIGDVAYVDGFNDYYGYGRVNAHAALEEITDAPTAVDLLSNYDTGVSSTDDLTKLDNHNSASKLQFEVSGTISGATVTVYAGDEEIGSAVASGTTTVVETDGTYDLTDGEHAISARQEESGKEASAESSALTITVDTVAPSTPSAPNLQAGSDSGVSSTDNLTNVSSATFDINTGGAPYYRVYCDSIQISENYESGSTFTDDDAGYRLEEAHPYVIHALDAAGNMSSVSSSLSVTFDRTAPSAPSAPDLQAGSDTGPEELEGHHTDNLTNDYTPTFDVSVSPYFRFYRNTTQISGNNETGSSYTHTEPDGAYSYKVSAVDTAGNESALSSGLDVTIHTALPTVAWGTPSGTTQNDPRGKGINEMVITFSDALYGLEKDNLYLKRDGADQDISGGSITLGTTDHVTWTISGLRKITSYIGSTLFMWGEHQYHFGGNLHLDSGVQDLYGNNFQPFSYTVNGSWHSRIRRGDMNGDGVLGSGDTTLFINKLVGSYPQASYPDVDADVVGDYTGEEVCNGVDTTGFTGDSGTTGDNSYPPAPDLQATSDSGVSWMDNSTTDTTPTLNVFFHTGATTYYRMMRDGNYIGGSQLTAATFTEASALSDGTYVYKVRGFDSGDQQVFESPTLSVTIDTTAPSAPSAPDLQADSDSGVSQTDNITNINDLMFDLTGASPYFRFFESSTQISGDYESASEWENMYEAYMEDDGTYNFTVKAVDAAGNVSAASSALSVTIDTAAPTVAIEAVSGDSQNPRGTGIDAIDITFSEAVYGFAMADLELDRDSNSVSLTNTTLTDSGNHIDWTLSDLKTETCYIGGTSAMGEHDYELKLPAGASYTDAAGNAGSLDSETWHAHIYRGDLNANGSYEDSDYSAGFYALNNPSYYHSTYPNTDEHVVGDKDYDGDFDYDDWTLIGNDFF